MNFPSPALVSRSVKILSPRHCYSHIKGLVSSSVQWIVSEYIMKVPGSLCKWAGGEDKDVTRLTGSTKAATVS